ncbi:hypothetical protein FOA52_015967 [Chlamydomonas sp. UWO 241]|nr:hypothetical protein FOA52_015967 [Chlamydomonas sp. UWO 241]
MHTLRAFMRPTPTQARPRPCAASLRELAPKQCREPAKKRAEHPEAAAGSPAPDTPAKKSKAAPNEPKQKAAPKEPKQSKKTEQAKRPNQAKAPKQSKELKPAVAPLPLLKAPKEPWPKPALAVLPPLKASIAGKWELIAGSDLLDLLNVHAGRMTEEMACFFFVQLLEAVTFMHAAGFCHRDIKAENCMVERSSHCLKLIDMCLCKHP